MSKTNRSASKAAPTATRRNGTKNAGKGKVEALSHPTAQAVEVVMTEDQYTWLLEASAYFRCTPGDYLLAAAFAFSTFLKKKLLGNPGEKMSDALWSFTFERMVPNTSPVFFSDDMGQYVNIGDGERALQFRESISTEDAELQAARRTLWMLCHTHNEDAR
ncbi:MAG: hypothetical protein LBV12_10070 [Puniceicoccales bacterium]|jgi:hypothetical protein|nr:hypothetical protein [Puniceicoccales bacterium]